MRIRFPPTPPPELTVAELAERYLQAHVAVNCRPSTMALYWRIVVTYILPELGELPIVAVDRARVSALHYQLRDKANKVGGRALEDLPPGRVLGLTPPRRSCRLVRRKWALMTSRDRRLFIRPAAGQRSRAPLLVGPRKGKFREGGGVKATPPSNVPAVTLGVFILWLGWFGFNGGSQLALSGAFDAVAVSNVLANTNLAAAAGVMAAISLSQPILGRVDLLVGLNGAIAGLVAITAGPDIVEHYWAVVIGAVGGAICVAGLKIMERLRIDNVVGAVPAHLFAGIWRTLTVCIAAGGDLLVQISGILAVGASGLAWLVIDRTIGARISPVA